jgi:hypothetical protein
MSPSVARGTGADKIIFTLNSIHPRGEPDRRTGHFATSTSESVAIEREIKFRKYCHREQILVLSGNVCDIWSVAVQKRLAITIQTKCLHGKMSRFNHLARFLSL